MDQAHWRRSQGPPSRRASRRPVLRSLRTADFSTSPTKVRITFLRLGSLQEPAHLPLSVRWCQLARLRRLLPCLRTGHFFMSQTWVRTTSPPIRSTWVRERSPVFPDRRSRPVSLPAQSPRPDVRKVDEHLPQGRDPACSAGSRPFNSLSRFAVSLAHWAPDD